MSIRPGHPSIYNLAAIRHAKRKKKKKALKDYLKFLTPPAYHKGMDQTFYRTMEWRKLRWQVLIASDGLCSMCGRGKQNGVTLHVDHIQPRSQFPHLELTKSNLQILCSDCNLGKGSSTWSHSKVRKSAP